MKRLENNVTIITGGGKGIGFGLASAFAQEGSNIVITGRNEERLLKAKEHLEKTYGVKVLTMVADGADEKRTKEVIEKTIGTFVRSSALSQFFLARSMAALIADRLKYSGIFGKSVNGYAGFCPAAFISFVPMQIFSISLSSKKSDCSNNPVSF